MKLQNDPVHRWISMLNRKILSRNRARKTTFHGKWNVPRFSIIFHINRTNFYHKPILNFDYYKRLIISEKNLNKSRSMYIILDRLLIFSKRLSRIDFFRNEKQKKAWISPSSRIQSYVRTPIYRLFSGERGRKRNRWQELLETASIFKLVRWQK